jgi:SAM-dependent methyltransferase
MSADLAVDTADRPSIAAPGANAAAAAACRACGATLRDTFVDLGLSPLCQTHVAPEQLGEPETFYPLHVRVCRECLLVQLPEFVAPEQIFTEYAYFSSYSDSWVEHARRHAHAMIDRLRLGPDSLVVEVASNDGYLLQHFVARGVPVLGVEPAANVAAVARARGIRTLNRFLGRDSAAEIANEYGRADLVVGNNVLAHVPDLNGFVAGLARLLKPDGVLTMEFPHLLRLIEQNQFDTIYHEHFSYLSLRVVEHVFANHGLRVYDVQELPTHGGSLRVHAALASSRVHPDTGEVARVKALECSAALDRLEGYAGFGERVAATKRDLLTFLIEGRRAGRRICGYGAPGKGNTLLNYCGIRTDLLEFTVDRNPYKQGKYTPGTRIPILAPEALIEARPDYVLILPWNLADEIVAANRPLLPGTTQFAVPVPALRVI